MFLPNVAEMAFCIVRLILSRGLLAPIESFDFLKATVYLIWRSKLFRYWRWTIGEEGISLFEITYNIRNYIQGCWNMMMMMMTMMMIKWQRSTGSPSHVTWLTPRSATNNHRWSDHPSRWRWWGWFSSYRSICLWLYWIEQPSEIKPSISLAVMILILLFI